MAHPILPTPGGGAAKATPAFDPRSLPLLSAEDVAKIQRQVTRTLERDLGLPPCTFRGSVQPDDDGRDILLGKIQRRVEALANGRVDGNAAVRIEIFADALRASANPHTGRVVHRRVNAAAEAAHAFAFAIALKEGALPSCRLPAGAPTDESGRASLVRSACIRGLNALQGAPDTWGPQAQEWVKALAVRLGMARSPR